MCLTIRRTVKHLLIQFVNKNQRRRSRGINYNRIIVIGLYQIIRSTDQRKRNDSQITIDRLCHVNLAPKVTNDTCQSTKSRQMHSLFSP